MRLQQQLLVEAKAENRKDCFDQELHNQIIIKQRQIFRIIMILHYFLLPEHKQQVELLRQEYLQTFHAEMVAAIQQLAIDVAQHRVQQTINVDFSLQELQQHATNLLANESHFDPAYLNSFVFLVGLLAKELKALEELLAQVYFSK